MRGYGADHRARRERLLRNHTDGDLCPKCKEPMYKSQGLDADHSNPRALQPDSVADQLTHSWCNRAEGQAIRRAKKKAMLSDDTPVFAEEVNTHRQSYCARKW